MRGGVRYEQGQRHRATQKESPRFRQEVPEINGTREGTTNPE